jgi:selenocysteine lyase/cysteine desulfurase
MEKSRKEFPMLEQYIYVNTASSGLLYDSLLDWRQEHDLDFLIGASNMKMKSLGLLTATKNAVGRFFNCVPENIALVPNFSLGLNIMLEGLDKKHRVLLLENDYPSVNWPFESRGFPLFYTKIEADMEQRIAEIIKAQKITVFALSLVQWVNGVQIDFEFLKHLKKEHPELLIIADGTQFCGTRVFNFEASGIDVLGASAYKWLLGGYGNGFMLFKQGIEDKFSLKTTGFNAANGDLTAGIRIPFSKHFEPGHLDTFNFGSLKFSLDYLTRLGVEKIEEHNTILCNKAKKELGELGLLEEIVLHRKEHGTIFKIKGDDALFQHLTKNDVICSQRGGGIRLSFHFYNTEKEIDKIIKILKKAQ